jgi:hypothetical protein
LLAFISCGTKTIFVTIYSSIVNIWDKRKRKKHETLFQYSRKLFRILNVRIRDQYRKRKPLDQWNFVVVTEMTLGVETIKLSRKNGKKYFVNFCIELRSSKLTINKQIRLDVFLQKRIISLKYIFYLIQQLNW